MAAGRHQTAVLEEQDAVELAEVLDLEVIRRRRLVRRTYAKGLLSSYGLVENTPAEPERRAA